MCFSPTASFVAAAVLTGVGAAAFAQRPEPKRIAFALIPFVFAAQQTIEGVIWLTLDAGRTPPQALNIAYLFFAQIFWPVYTPLSVLLMEQEQRRRWALTILLVTGVVVAGALAVTLAQHDYSVRLVRHSLHYSSGHQFEHYWIGAYVLATVAPLLISPHRYVMAFGVTVLAGSIVTAYAFHYAAASVWCYFAAIGSIFVFLHIRRRSRLMGRR